MRLRLDKLVLSAGLALAMVATSIPAIAGTPTTSTQESEGLSLNGKTVKIVKQDENFVFENEEDELAFAKAQKGVEVGGAAEAVTGVEGYVGKILSINVTPTKETPTVINVSDAGEAINNKSISDELELEGGVSLPGYKITVTNKYTKKVTYDFSALITEDNNETTDTNEFKNEIETKYENDSSVAYEIQKASAAFGVTVTPSLPEGVNQIKTKADAKKIEVTYTAETTKEYTVTTLTGGYTYDYLYPNEKTKEVKIYKKVTDAKGSVSADDQEYTVVNNGANLKISVTDLESEYYLASKTVSSSGNLFFGDDEDGKDATEQAIKVTDTVSLTVVSTSADNVEAEDKAAFKAVADEIGATVAGYFDASLTGTTNKYTDSEVTIKIVKPRDIEALAGEGKTIKYTVIRSHEGLPVEALETNSDGEYITFSSKYFSTYALAYEIVDAAETPAEEPTTVAPAQEDTQPAAADPEAAKGAAEKADTGVKAGDNSMMPLFMTTLLLALCAGSLAIYKEKKTN